MEEKTIINKTEKPSSWEVGATGNRFKIYFSDSEDLDKQVSNLIKKGFKIER